MATIYDTTPGGTGGGSVASDANGRDTVWAVLALDTLAWTGFADYDAAALRWRDWQRELRFPLLLHWNDTRRSWEITP